MKEAIGGTWLINLILFFMMVIISYLGVSLNYTRAFRVKNYVISVLEESGNKSEALEKMDSPDQGENFYKSVGYTRADIEGSISQAPSTGGVGFAKSCKFLVKIPLEFVIPLINYKVPIYASGETRTIYNASGSCNY